ncbi:discoidin domain-containing protein [Virgisporangium aurantiacum]|uniref:F5/8 type C domain-containing protein n=1 Tax=Virgisporangium aurantiacum TaxID=175570 RepID=A0A8J4DZS0_9ACTN|nr:discoidin domain-containing protein [Virgisporangium aurantiacum]GIJ55991.1 hypothetical protein Vau01_035070 [Virgisporangium aurantiacum]
MNLSIRRRCAALLAGVLAAVSPATSAAAEPAGQAAIIPPPTTETQIYSRLSQLLTPALRSVAGDTQVRTLTRTVAARQFDGDTNALLSTVVQEAEESHVVDPNAPDWVALKNSIAQFGNINGYSFDPQVYIPNLDEGIVPAATVEIVVSPLDESAASAESYVLDGNGNAVPSGHLVDETYVETHEVWVLSVNERITTGGPPVLTGEVVAVPAPRVFGPESTKAGTLAACNPTGLRNNRGQEYLQRWRVPNKSDFGGLFEGKREMKLVAIAGNGAVVKTYFFGKVKRKHIDNWQNSDLYITTWDRAVWGEYMGYQWYELDGGKTVTSTVTVPVQGGGSISTSVQTQERDDDGGSHAVLFSESTYLEYDTGRVRFNMCSTGGDGGTGTDNLACGAVASASSTFSGYSAARTTDCNNSTALGGPYSWANSANTYPPNNPQWVQADMGVDKTFRRVVVYTSQGYPIRDFDVQVWNGVTFVTVASVTGNTQLSVPVTFPARTSRLVRILGRSGPNHQLNYVRVNELEVYAV